MDALISRKVIHLGLGTSDKALVVCRAKVVFSFIFSCLLVTVAHLGFVDVVLDA